MENIDLFDSVVESVEMHESFRDLISAPGKIGCKRLMNEIFNSMPNPDPHFVREFQTQGFDARVFELGLFAVFLELGMTVKQEFDRPDFILETQMGEVCVEATTSNPPDHLKLTNLAKQGQELSKKELGEKIRNELPIRFGSPLFSKLKKRYWDLPQCKDKPLILAIQASHEPFASQFPSTSLICYVYGTESYPTWSEDGDLIVNEKQISEHKLDDKKIIPSNFFGQPDTENISAVLFSNQLTISKFTRMAFQNGYDTEGLKIIRTGTCHNPDPNAIEPLMFSYELGTQDAHIETWAEGLSLIINANAEEPVVPFTFPGVTTHIHLDGELSNIVNGFHPFNNQSAIMITKPKK